jgi:hypothetical protein
LDVKSPARGWPRLFLNLGCSTTSPCDSSCGERKML